jgi:hypothetical protein
VFEILAGFLLYLIRIIKKEFYVEMEAPNTLNTTKIAFCAEIVIIDFNLILQV